ncbi:MAG: alkaline phosphatase family protein [Aeropyrum sp.]|nr:alkaline phosphatase family protein [Aeropyrum sp.]MCE4615522.1 alkaline phosphatase family protein [Aeropyrum sp.]
MERLFVLGLDSVPYRFVEEGLLELGDFRFYELRSTNPPITVPAWAVMMTGKTAGELGVYGFRHRKPGSAESSYVVTSRSVSEPWPWDVLGSRGLRSIVVGVPPSFPPRPLKGLMVSCFLTPDRSKPYTWPSTLKREVESVSGGYVFDVKYRSDDKESIKRGLWSLAERQFRVVKRLLTTRKWDFAMYMHIGTDRVHHAFWKFFDKEHPRYPGEGNPFEDVIPEYYSLVSNLAQDLIESLPRDTRVLIVSDHGAKAMKGGFAINQWLIEEGYLKLKGEPRKPGTELTTGMIDWERTIAWAWGGYYSRVFINLKGREPEGIVEKEEYEDVVKQLKRDIEKIRGPDGEAWENTALTPHEIYPAVKGDAPDLMVYLDNLSWRPAGTLGWPSLYLEENDRGPDDAVHDWTGIIGGDPEVLGLGRPESIEGVSSLVLRHYGLEGYTQQ